MKTILLISAVFFAAAAFGQQPTLYDEVVSVTIPATSLAKLQNDGDSLLRVANARAKTIDSLKTKLFLANYRVEKVRFYLAICLRNPSQTKFLKGWIRRAIN